MRTATQTNQKKTRNKTRLMAKTKQKPAAAAGGGSRQPCKIRRVIDGDTVAAGRSRGLLLDWLPSPEFRIRLQNIDAWESDQALGGPSTKALRKMTPPGKKFWLESAGKDQYDRVIGTLNPGKDSPPEQSYNYRMVAQGYAKTYMAKGAMNGLYRQAEREAQAAKRGNWKSRHSRKDPAQHRRGQKEKARQEKGLTAWILLTLGALALTTLLLAFAAHSRGIALPLISDLLKRISL